MQNLRIEKLHEDSFVIHVCIIARSELLVNLLKIFKLKPTLCCIIEEIQMHLTLPMPTGCDILSPNILVYDGPVLMSSHSESQFAFHHPTDHVAGTILCQDLLSDGFPKFLTIKDDEIAFDHNALGHGSLGNFNRNQAVSGALA